MTQTNPAIEPLNPSQAAARLVEWFGPLKAREVAVSYALGRWSDGDLAGEAAWRRVLDVLDAWEQAQGVKIKH